MLDSREEPRGAGNEPMEPLKHGLRGRSGPIAALLISAAVQTAVAQRLLRSMRKASMRQHFDMGLKDCGFNQGI
jgi:hypothetical protein